MSDRIKVLVVIGQLELGGTERQLLQILPAINKDPLESVVYSMRGAGALEKRFKTAGVRIISPAHHSRRWFGLMRTALHLLAVWHAERPAVVHFYLPEAYLLGAICSFLAPSCVRLMSRRGLNKYQSKWPGARGIERILHRRMDAILANSNAVLAELIEEGADPAKCAVIYNGVAVPREDLTEQAFALRTNLALRADAIVLLMVANLIPYKGHADLLQAFESARVRLPAGSVLLLLGKNAGIQSALEQQAARAGIDDAVKFLGPVDDVQPYMAIADIVVHASHEEGFSNAILEAMAAGRPVIASDVGGNAEAVSDGETGILVPPRDPEALAQALVDLSANGPLRARMASAARARASGLFSLDRCVAAYRRLYVRLARGDDGAVASLIAADFK